MRRSAVSIPSNITEGAGRHHKNEFKQFLYIALSSSAELETELIIAANLEFLSKINEAKLISELNTIARMIQGLIKSLTGE